MAQAQVGRAVVIEAEHVDPTGADGGAGTVDNPLAASRREAIVLGHVEDDAVFEAEDLV